jgi:2-polyprenyl-3-methyl-5-hydroxy-6-metoxy-1,4-benzoquinol methylase
MRTTRHNKSLQAAATAPSVFGRGKQSQLAKEMLAFLEATPLSPDLAWTKDWDFLYHFEAERQMHVRDLLAKAGVQPDSEFNVLDVGYLHGLTQEFLHRAFPRAAITVYDLPSSPIFSDKQYLQAIEARGYLRLVPQNIDDLREGAEKYDVIVLGEVVEHMDPTQVARALHNVRRVAAPNAVLIITTPNAAGLYNCYMTLKQKDAIQVAPISNKTHGYGHIHLWSLNLLRQTAEVCGWTFLDARFYHGREGEKFEEIKKAWVGLGAQINIRLLKILADKNPRWRGFFVAAFTAKDSQAED